jgi:hypothetical protein
MTTQKQVNGVNVEQLFQTIDAIKVTPKIAKFKFSAKNQWQGGGHNRTTINEFEGACQRHARKEPFVLDNDEPPVLLGKDIGAKATSICTVSSDSIRRCATATSSSASRSK